MVEPNLESVPLQESLIAAVYARVSTGRQEQEQTIKAQMQEMRTTIQTDGNRLLEDNVFLDDGWTGEILQRPGLDAMRHAAKSGQFQILYVYDRGRISRMFAYQEVVIEELETRRITFRSLQDCPATTPEEKVMQAMQGVFHQYERVKIAERFRIAKLYKASHGCLVSGQLPYGYTRVNRSKDRPAHGLINDDEANVVRQIREWFGNERLSIHKIVERLFDLNVPPPKKEGPTWSRSTVLRILTNAAYHTGTVYFNKMEAIVPLNPLKAER